MFCFQIGFKFSENSTQFHLNVVKAYVCTFKTCSKLMNGWLLLVALYKVYLFLESVIKNTFKDK